MKIDAPIDSSSDTFTGQRQRQHQVPTQTSTFETRNHKDNVPTNSVTSNTLDVQRHCTECGHALHKSIFSPVVKSEGFDSKIAKHPSLPKCPSCTAVQSLSAHVGCVICGEVISGMFIPCLECGHVCCFECHQQWFSLQRPHAENAQDLSDLECPSPCGCSCTEHSETVVILSPSATPTHDDKGNLLGPHNRLRSEIAARSRLGIMAGQTDDDLDAWRGSSFARGLGGGLSRVLTGSDRSRRTSSVNRKVPLDRIETM